MGRGKKRMRESRREKVLDLINKLEKALRNIDFLKEEIQFTEGFTWKGNSREIEEGNLDEVRISVVDFLHTLYHAVKKRDVEE